MELPFSPGWLGQNATIIKQSKPRAKASDHKDPQALLMAELLLDAVKARVPNAASARAVGAHRSKVIASWSVPIERLHRIDGISWLEISETIAWVRRSEFWGGVILSGENLREKWDKIQAQRGAKAARQRGRHEPSGNHSDGEQQL